MKFVAFLVITLAALLVMADDAPKGATYSGLAMIVPASGPAVSNFFTIKVTRWTSDPERAQLEDVLMKEGSRRLVDALHDQPETGTMRIGSAKPVLLHYARKSEEGGETKLVVATDRPLTVKELRWGDMSPNYDVAVAILRIVSESPLSIA